MPSITVLYLVTAAALLRGVVLCQEERFAAVPASAPFTSLATEEKDIGKGSGKGTLGSGSSSSSSSPEQATSAYRLIRWIQSNGGYVESRQEIREGDEGIRGVYATEFIPEGTVLLSLPADLIISPDYGLGDAANQCGTISALKREMALGSESRFAPYVQVLGEYAEGGGTGGLMDTWTAAGRALLDEVLGRYLPPRERNHNVNMWTKFCGGDPDNDPLGLRAMLLMASRATPVEGLNVPKGGKTAKDDRGPISMIPFFDLYNHRNAPYHNVEKRRPDSSDSAAALEMRALRDIPAGEQIYYRYHSPTSDILRDYGFVEQYPQHWVIPTPDGRRGTFVLQFELRESGGVKVTSRGQVPTPARMFLRNELKRLGEVRNKVKRRREQERRQRPQGGTVSKPERNEELLVWQYHRAISRAIKSVLEELDGTGRVQRQGMAGRTDASEGDEL